MRRIKQIVLLAVVLAVPCTVVLAQQRNAVPYRVIVNPGSPNTNLDRKFVSDAFLKKVTRWNEGEIIKPVDLDMENPARKKFSEDILKRSASAVKSYWQQLVFSGREIPPPELDNDDEVIRYVLKHTGSIGYVSGNASLDRVKVVTIR